MKYVIIYLENKGYCIGLWSERGYYEIVGQVNSKDLAQSAVDGLNMVAA